MASADGHGDQSLPMKKRKMSKEEHTENPDSSTNQNSFFEDFKLIKVLRGDDRHKIINIHGTLPLRNNEEDLSGDNNSNSINDSQDAVVVLERKPFDPVKIEEFIKLTNTKETLHNDIYSTFDVFSSRSQADVKATLIFPATQKHISKYSEHQPYVINETPELYEAVTKPCLEGSKFSIQWVYNILNKTTESERIVVEDPDPDNGFVMVPDMKWDGQKVESLYLVAIVHRKDLKSIRELNETHLPLLRNILHKGQDAIKSKYGVTPDKLRVYFHYQPSYYHLHIHFTHISYDAPGSDVLRAHLLTDVIDNLMINPDFYRKKTLSYVVRDGDQLYQAYRTHGYLK